MSRLIARHSYSNMQERAVRVSSVVTDILLNMPHARFINFYLLLFFGLVALNISVYREIFASPVGKISVFEVGKGNRAILVRTPHNRTILVDTGPDASILRALGETLPMWQRKIDAVILTGTKASLVGGLPEVESRYHVATIMRVGDRATPYGTSVLFDTVGIKIMAPDTETISYGATTLVISSSTPPGAYVSDGKMITKTR